MADELVSFSTRISKRQHKRMLDICGATGSEVSCSEITRLALDCFYAQLEVCPSLLPKYDPKKDRSARQNKRASRKSEKCKTNGDL